MRENWRGSKSYGITISSGWCHMLANLPPWVVSLV
ncbi:hypothetical protein A2U01_0081199, partial [Trifolium medium]|nr:hypothetical protein [Trifolium medium]